MNQNFIVIIVEICAVWVSEKANCSSLCFCGQSFIIESFMLFWAVWNFYNFFNGNIVRTVNEDNTTLDTVLQ